MSWTPMILDEQGLKELIPILERALLEAIAVQDSTKERLASSGAMGLSYTVSILGYPSVGGQKKVGPPTDAKELSGSAGPKATKASKKKAKAVRKGRTVSATAEPKRKAAPKRDRQSGGDK